MKGHTARRFGAVVEIIADGLAGDELRGGDAPSLALLFCCIMDQHISALIRLPSAPSLLTAAGSDVLVDAFLHGCGAGRRAAFSLPELCR